MIVNGLTLPDAPAEVLASYPNIVIMTSSAGNTTAYVLIAANAAIGKCTGSVVGSSWAEMLLSSGAGVCYGLSDDGTEWKYNTSKESGGFTFQLGDTGSVTTEVVWANHDIYEITSVNPSTGAYTKGDIWFPNSETPKPTRYSIAKAILDAVARQIMRLTDSTAKVKPEEFEPKLEGINIQLQELTVTATEEVQTITPPSGVYGFSKVIVEAVEDSGGTGGGGAGEGEEPEDKYTSAENVGFGDIIEESTVLTYGGLECPDLVGGEYKIIVREEYTGNIYLMTGSGSFYYDDYFTSVTYYRVECNSTITYYPMGTEWGEGSTWFWAIDIENPVKPEEIYTVLYTTHDIADKVNGGVWMAAMQPEETTTIVRTPVEHDDTYLIDGSIANDLAVITQKITGVNDTMSPSEVAEALEEYYKSLNPESGA